MNEITHYGLALLAEEGGEVASAAAKALRFGVDSPAQSTRRGEPPTTARAKLTLEAADVLAAIVWAARAGILDPTVLAEAATAKLNRLIDPAVRDNLGRPLAPPLDAPVRFELYTDHD